MPGPGVELIGEEEIAEVMEVLTSRFLSRYGPEDDPAFGAKVRHVEREAAALAGVRLIEDCAQAFGATYHGRGVGGVGVTGAYSFNEYKTITCGDGGLIVTDDEDLHGRLFAIHDQGHAPYRLGSKYAERPFLGMN